MTELVVIAGIPNLLAKEFPLVNEKNLGKPNRKIIWSPLPENVNIYTDKYISKLYAKFAKAINELTNESTAERLSPLNASAILIYLDHPKCNGNRVLEAFFPETLTLKVPPPQLPSAPAARSKLQAANYELIRTLSDALKKAGQTLPILKKEITSRDNKTPLLLPVRNFDRDLVGKLLSEIQIAILSMRPQVALREVTDEFERANPKKRLDHDRKFYFVNPKGLVFKSPGRQNRHGAARQQNNVEHPVTCLIRSRLRLGAPFDPQFHYDCQPLRGALARGWRSCHDQAFSALANREHVNIAPNDNVR